MHKTTTVELVARFDVISMALQEVARALPQAQAIQVAGAVRQRVAALADEPMSSAADEAVTAELAPLLAASRASAP
jgi:hypothetical protein